MRRQFEKTAGGELTARFARWASTPIKGTPKLFQKIRTGPELDALEQGIRNGAEKYVNGPIRRGLTAVRADRGMGHAASPFVGRERGQALGRRAVDYIADKPHMGVMGAIPLPGMTPASLAIEKGRTSFINNTPGLKMKTASMGQLSEALKDPTVRKIIAIGGGALLLKHLFDDARADFDQGFRQGPGDERPFSYSRNWEKSASRFDGASRRTTTSRQPVPPAGGRLLEKVAKVAPYQQATQHTCSAACLKAVLDHYGFEGDEHDIAGFIGVRQKGGAETDQIANAARRLGFDCFEYSFDSLEQAKFLTDQDIPIIADIQSFNHPGSGHYVVIADIDDESVHIMDPNTPGNERIISHQEADERWWDRAMKPPHKMMKKWGIVVLPPEQP